MVFCLHVRLCHLHVWCSQVPEEDTRSLGTGVTDGCKPPHGRWELNPSSLEENTCVLLPAEPLLQPRTLLGCAQKAEAGGSLSSGQRGLHGEALFKTAMKRLFEEDLAIKVTDT